MKFFRILVILVLVCGLACSFAFAADENDENEEQRVDITQQEVETTVLRLSASDTSGFHSVLLGLLGDYNSIVKDYTYITTSYNGTQQTNHVVEITPDYSWISSAAIFAICIYSLFRIIGIALGGIRK